MFFKGTPLTWVIRFLSYFAHIWLQWLLLAHHPLKLTFAQFFLKVLLSLVHEHLLLPELANIGFSLKVLKLKLVFWWERGVRAIHDVAKEVGLSKDWNFNLSVKHLLRHIFVVILIEKLSSWLFVNPRSFAESVQIKLTSLRVDTHNLTLLVQTLVVSPIGLLWLDPLLLRLLTRGYHAVETVRPASDGRVLNIDLEEPLGLLTNLVLKIH